MGITQRRFNTFLLPVKPAHVQTLLHCKVVLGSNLPCYRIEWPGCFQVICEMLGRSIPLIGKGSLPFNAIFRTMHYWYRNGGWVFALIWTPFCPIHNTPIFVHNLIIPRYQTFFTNSILLSRISHTAAKIVRWRTLHQFYGAVTPWRFSQRMPTYEKFGEYAGVRRISYG